MLLKLIPDLPRSNLQTPEDTIALACLLSVRNNGGKRNYFTADL